MRDAKQQAYEMAGRVLRQAVEGIGPLDDIDRDVLAEFDLIAQALERAAEHRHAAPPPRSTTPQSGDTR